MISKEDSRSKLDLEEIQESADEEPIVNTDTQPELVTPVKPDDISLPIRRTSGRVSKPPQFYYGFLIEEDKISDSTLRELDKPVNYTEEMSSPETAKWKEAISEDESCIYVKVSGSVVVFLVLYVDDILLIGNDIPMLQSVKDWLGKCFKKYLGDAAYILGIKIYRDRSKRLIGLSQDTYLDKFLKRFKMEKSKKGNLPLHYGIKISKDLCLKTNEELDKMSQVPYALAVGLIMYAMTRTRPDVSFSLSMGSSDMEKFKARYNLGVVPTVEDSIEIFCDNNSAVALTKEPKDHENSKHIERKYHFVRSKVEEGHVIVKHVRSEDNPTNLFKKALAKSRHDEHARSIGLKVNIKF
ncbi:retrotransposon protein, putative, ty1-copia subclass [Tanacetum coccineum]